MNENLLVSPNKQLVQEIAQDKVEEMERRLSNKKLKKEYPVKNEDSDGVEVEEMERRLSIKNPKKENPVKNEDSDGVKVEEMEPNKEDEKMDTSMVREEMD